MSIEIDQPIKDIYKFHGVLSNKDSQLILDLKQFMPRGSYLRNSDDVFVMVVYTGEETKMVMNQGQYQFKISKLMYMFNVTLSIALVVFFLLIIFSSQLGNRLGIRSLLTHTYIYDEVNQGKEVNVEDYTFKSIFTFFILYNSLFPLDLPVSLLFSRILYTYVFLENDAQMVSEEHSCNEDAIVGASVKNMIVLDDLSRVNHIFCDKTGTLTKNELIFNGLAIGSCHLHLSEAAGDLEKYGQIIKEKFEALQD